MSARLISRRVWLGEALRAKRKHRRETFQHIAGLGRIDKRREEDGPYADKQN